MEAKKAAGYYTPDSAPTQDAEGAVGRSLEQVLTLPAEARVKTPTRRPLALLSAQRRCASGRTGCWRSGSRTGWRISRSISSAWTPRADLCRRRRSRKPIRRLTVPFHARWRHFVVGRRDRWARARRATRMARCAPTRARAEFDLAIVSASCSTPAPVPRWPYRDAATGERRPLRGAGAGKLRHVRERRFLRRSARAASRRCGACWALTRADLGAAFRSSDANPLVGLDGRAALLARSARRRGRSPDVFALAR